ncbi:MAG: hypothetical protein DMC59_08220 [Verrucomicrobia bacterium]|nr:MAG: hypothetical protein DMC59_08220 [Verrucomicrobiota bacterium]
MEISTALTAGTNIPLRQNKAAKSSTNFFFIFYLSFSLRDLDAFSDRRQSKLRGNLTISCAMMPGTGRFALSSSDSSLS